MYEYHVHDTHAYIHRIGLHRATYMHSSRSPTTRPGSSVFGAVLFNLNLNQGAAVA